MLHEVFDVVEVWVVTNFLEVVQVSLEGPLRQEVLEDVGMPSIHLHDHAVCEPCSVERASRRMLEACLVEVKIGCECWLHAGRKACSNIQDEEDRA